MSTPIIEIKNLTKSFGTNMVLKDFSTTIQKGEVVGIIGPSGSGKSTLLRCINFLEIADSGSISIAGEEVLVDNKGGHSVPALKIAQLRTKVGMVFQQFNLFPHLTAIQNIIAGPKYVLKEDQKEREQPVTYLKWSGYRKKWIISQKNFLAVSNSASPLHVRLQ